jgi:hypothetical protein
VAGPLLRANQRNYSTAGNTYHLNGGHFEVCVNEVLRIGNYFRGTRGAALSFLERPSRRGEDFFCECAAPSGDCPSLNNYRACGESQQTGANCSCNVSGCSHLRSNCVHERPHAVSFLPVSVQSV